MVAVQPTGFDRDHGSSRDLLGAYALGAVTPEERRAVAAHLEGCGACRTELTRLRAAVHALPLALRDREPPPALRDRIEAGVLSELAEAGRPEARDRRPSVLRPHVDHATASAVPVGSRAGRRFVTPWAAVAALLLAVSLGMLVWNLRLQQSLDQQEAAAIALRPARLAARGASGRLADLGDREAMVVTVRGLPSLAPGLVYELWPVGPDAAVPASPTARGQTDAAVVVDPAPDNALSVVAKPGPAGRGAGGRVATARLARAPAVPNR